MYNSVTDTCPVCVLEIPEIKPQDQWFTRRTPRIQHRVTFTADSLQCKDTEQNQQREKTNEKKSQEIRHRLPKSSPKVVTQELLMATHVKYCLLGKLFRNSVPWAFTGTGHIESLCLTCIQISDSYRKSGCSAQITLYNVNLLLFKGFYISVGKLFTIQIPRLQPKPTLQADLSKDSSLRLTEGTFLQRVQETSMCSLLVGWDLWCLSSCDALSSREGICGIRNEERIWDIGLVGLHPRDKSHQRSHNRNLGEDFQRARINIQAKTSNIP